MKQSETNRKAGSAYHKMILDKTGMVKKQRKATAKWMRQTYVRAQGKKSERQHESRVLILGQKNSKQTHEKADARIDRKRLFKRQKGDGNLGGASATLDRRH